MVNNNYCSLLDLYLQVNTLRLNIPAILVKTDMPISSHVSYELFNVNEEKFDIFHNCCR